MIFLSIYQKLLFLFASVICLVSRTYGDYLTLNIQSSRIQAEKQSLHTKMFLKMII